MLGGQNMPALDIAEKAASCFDGYLEGLNWFSRSVHAHKKPVVLGMLLKASPEAVSEVRTNGYEINAGMF
jgi:hypothetical protein